MLGQLVHVFLGKLELDQFGPTLVVDKLNLEGPLLGLEIGPTAKYDCLSGGHVLAPRHFSPKLLDFSVGDIEVESLLPCKDQRSAGILHTTDRFGRGIAADSLQIFACLDEAFPGADRHAPQKKYREKHGC